VAIPFETASILSLWDLGTNDTPVTILVLDWNETVMLILPNITEMRYDGIEFVEIWGSLNQDYISDYAEVVVTREAADVVFELRIITMAMIMVTPLPEPIPTFLIGYIIGIVLIVGGFYLIERVIRDYDLQIL
jgi:hypothetical protein